MGIKLINIRSLCENDLRFSVYEQCMKYFSETSYKPIVYLNKKSYETICPFSYYNGKQYFEDNGQNKITIDGIEYKIQDEIYVGYRRVELDDDILMLA